MLRIAKVGLGTLVWMLPVVVAAAEPLPIVTGVELQPLAAQTKRVVQALELVGSPLVPAQQTAIDKALENTDAARGGQGNSSRARSAVPRGREHQSRKPRQGGRRPGPGEVVAARAAGVSGQGAQRRRA